MISSVFVMCFDFLLHCGQYTRGSAKVMPPVFLLRKFNCNNNEIYVDDSYIFCNYEAIFPVSFIFSTLLSMLSKMLYTSVVKFPASTSEHIMETLFQLTVICKMASTHCILYKAKQAVVRGCQIWAMSRMVKNSLFHFCYCFTCAQACMRQDFVVKEKAIFHV
jgi:hypothetical protein